ncbi:MAG: cob(I)yrinic acid a,c-diamide adenosyltransferase [Victivallales bacterium]|nr:cob(I)yrinic acid a,c-diamide adenosyltransferase [Victivallales bacterium]
MIEPQEKERRRGLVLNFTGNGKGKTTGALGTAIRALGWGWRVAILQFVKDDRDTGERRFLAGLPHPPEFLSLGRGATWTPDVNPEQHRTAAARAWQIAAARLNNPDIDLLILDELNIALHQGWIDPDIVIAALQHRPTTMHVIITGRHAPEKLLAASDLVSEINELKHPFQHGIMAQPGIEY